MQIYEFRSKGRINSESPCHDFVRKVCTSCSSFCLLRGSHIHSLGSLQNFFIVNCSLFTDKGIVIGQE